MSDLPLLLYVNMLYMKEYALVWFPSSSRKWLYYYIVSLVGIHSEASPVECGLNCSGYMQERMSRSLTVCQDKYEAAKLQPSSSNPRNDLESCVDLSVRESINLIPHVAGKLKAYLAIENWTLHHQAVSSFSCFLNFDGNKRILPGVIY